MPRLYTLFSGSSGNCNYIGSEESGILIDAGRSARQITQALAGYDLDIRNIKAVFVTHEHIDHVKGLKVLSSKYGMKVYASKGTAEALYEKGYVNSGTEIEIVDRNGVELDDMRITAFDISHDCAEGLGYVVETSDGRRTAFATDTGYVTDSMKMAVGGCDTVLIESNHDVQMLQNGAYPYLLKRRILSDVGHLSNDVCADTVTELVKSGSTRFILAHLSRENNMPILARQTAVCALQQNNMKENIDFMLTVASESGNKPIIF